MNQPVLATHNLSVGYHQRRGQSRSVLQNLSLTLANGEFVCLLGANGAGKSTLIRTLTHMQAPISGSITINQQPLQQLSQAQLAKQLSVVLTDRLQVSNLSGYELVSLGRMPYTNMFGSLNQHDHQVIRWALHATNSDDLAQRLLNEMSDGERQRIMIARALAQEPAVMILDEPTAFLDLPRRVEITSLLRKLAHETGLAAIMSTHDLDLAIGSADRLWLVLDDGSVECGTPEDLILDGRLAQTFRKSQLHFDQQRGGFRSHSKPIGKVQLSASGLDGQWMQHALERYGYQVIASGQADCPHIQQLEHNRWQIEHQPCATIGQVLAYLGHA
ncbi:ABC transporter ATP-binding protein [Herpetosiphon gulosus]|uniref:Vitamin B12 import ATP-binding protein BtuD n=1 Tax=Herpetosiphon gulosus TaxID=1973496 RepID=A0ABP9X6V4_9CHLR